MYFQRQEKPDCFWAVWLFLSSLILSTPTQAQGLQEATRVYREKFARSPQGIYLAKGMIFLVIEADNFPREGTISAARAKASVRLTKTKRLLHSHVVEAYYPPNARIKQSPLLNRHPIVRKLMETHFPALLLPQFKFQLKGHQLESDIKKGRYRYVVAYYENEFKRQIPKELAGAEGEDVLFAINKLKQKYTDDKAWPLLGRFHLQTGALEEALSLSGKLLAAEYPLASFPARPVEDLATFYTNLADAHRLLEGKSSAKAIAQALGKAPALPQALDQLAALCRKEDRHLQAANIHLMNLAGSSNLKDGWAKVLEDVRTQVRVGNTKAHQQYLKLLTVFSTTPMPVVYGDKEDVRGILRGVWRTFGHLNFPGAWSAEEPMAYRKAMELFAARGDINRMIVCLKAAVLQSPRHAPSWNLLGRCLMIQRKHTEALPALNQAARLHDEALPRTNLTLCYETLKYPELAQGMALAALLAPNNTDWTREQANRIIGQ